MIKPYKLEHGDKVAIISLSRGLLGEPFMEEQKNLIEKRIKEFNLEIVYTPNALKGIDYLRDNPAMRAADLKWAFSDNSIKAIICAIGGDDTYKTIPYLLDDKEFIKNVKNNPKIFMGYSDTTINHLMFHKIGLMTYYGPTAIVDFGELANDMLPYTKESFRNLFNNQSNIEIESSPFWYMERTSFDSSQIGKDRITKKEIHGYEVLNGSGTISGELFGGCLESLSELISGDRYSDEAIINNKYNLFPNSKELLDKILFLETSEEQPTPEKLKELLEVLEKKEVFKYISGVIIGKPQDETYYDEYKKIYKEVIGKYNKPILFNMNFGHAHPRCILPYGGSVTIDLDNKKVLLNENLVK